MTGRIKAQSESILSEVAMQMQKRQEEAVQTQNMQNQHESVERARTVLATLSTAIPQVSLLASSLFLANRNQRSLSGEEARARDCHRILSYLLDQTLIHLIGHGLSICLSCVSSTFSTSCSRFSRCLIVQPANRSQGSG